MSSDHDSSTSRDSVAFHLEHETGIRAADCYQCGKCSAGCPVAEEMDVAPSQVLRLLQLEMPRHDRSALGARAIWLCIGCETCVTRCPQEVNLPRVMDYLRQEAASQKVAHEAAGDILAFHRAFLDSIETHGRMYELGMLVDYKMRTGHFLQDAMLAPAAMMKGKIGLFPHGADDKKSIAAIFERSKKGTES
jgi:heterodisulfide reductase subunit C2